ncbi:Uncharacterised protein [Mycobacterium tuberculosis]|nr:Uncharacterised protein [Mycobacterium tuberculosis]
MLTPASSDTSTATIEAWSASPKLPELSRFSRLARSPSSIWLTDSASSTSRPNWLNSLRAIG